MTYCKRILGTSSDPNTKGLFGFFLMMIIYIVWIYASCIVNKFASIYRCLADYLLNLNPKDLLLKIVWLPWPSVLYNGKRESFIMFILVCYSNTGNQTCIRLTVRWDWLWSMHLQMKDCLILKGWGTQFSPNEKIFPPSI